VQVETFASLVLYYAEWHVVHPVAGAAEGMVVGYEGGVVENGTEKGGGGTPLEDTTEVWR